MIWPRGPRLIIPVIAVALIGVSAVLLRLGAPSSHFLGDPPLTNPIALPAWFAVFALIGMYVLPEFDGKRKDDPPLESGHGADEIPTSAFNHAPYGVVLVNPDGSKAYVNAAYSEITGYEPGETMTLAQGIINLFPDPVLRQEATKAWTEALGRSGVESTFPCTCKDGGVKDIQFRTVALEDGRMLLMMADVTAQKHAERMLQARLEIERVIAEISTKLVSCSDVDAAIRESLGVLGSQRAASRAYIYRFSEDGQYLDRTHEWCSPGVEPMIEQLTHLPSGYFVWGLGRIKNNEPVVVNDLASLREGVAEGKALLIKHGLHSIALLPMQVGDEIAGVLGFDNPQSGSAWSDDDIMLLRTAAEIIGHALARRAAEEAIGSSEERYRSLVESTPDGVFCLDSRGRLTSLNEAFETLLGWSRDEWLGKDFLPLIHPEDQEKAIGFFMRCLMGESTGLYSIRILLKDGDYRRGEFALSPLRHDGNIVGVQGMARDITDREAAETALRESEERYRELVECAKDVIYTLGPDGTLTSINKAFETVLGWSRDEWVGQPFSPLVHPDDMDVAVAGFMVVLGGEPHESVLRIRTSAGDYRSGMFTSVPYVQDGNVVGVLAIARDVTERRRSEEALQNARRRGEALESVINKSPAIAFTWRATEQCPVEYVSDNVTMFGYTPDDVLTGRITFGAIMHPDDFARVAENVAQHMIDEEDEFAEEYRIITKSGEIRWVDDRTWVCRAEDGSITHYQGIMVDMTERKQAEDELRAALKRREELEAIINKSPAVAFAWIPVAGRPVVFMSDSVEQFGYAAEELTSGMLSLEDLVVEEDKQMVVQEMRRHMANRDAEFSQEYRVHTKSGDIRWIEDRTYVEYDDAGRPVLCKGMAVDITDRKEAVEAVHEHEQYLCTIMESVQAGLMIVDGETHRITDANPVAARMLGRNSDEIIGSHCHRYIEGHETCGCPLATGGKLVDDTECRLKRGDGGSMAVMKTAALISLKGRPYVLESFVDITDRKRAEERFTKLNECFLEFGPSPDENINRIVALCGKLLEAECAMYNRLEGDTLQSLGTWNIPSEYEGSMPAEGWFCTKVVSEDSDQVLVIRNLGATPETTPDALPAPLRLQTYVGRGVRENSICVGSLCVMFSRDYEPTSDDERLMGILAAAVGVEEERRSAEAALRESEEKYRDLVQNANSIILRMDKEGRVTFFNEFAERFFGYEQEEILGKSVIGTIVPLADSGGGDLAAMVRDIAFNPHAYGTNENENMLRDGTRVWVAWTNQVILDEQGEVAELLCVGQDVTVRRRTERALHASENLLSSIIDQSPVPTWIADPQGRCIRRNAAYAELLGIVDDDEDVEEYCILTDQTIVDQGHIDAVKAVFECGESARFPLDHVPKGSTRSRAHRMLDVTIFPVKDESGRVVNAVIQHDDITERSRAERELRKTMSELERFNRLSVGRELRMIELKREVNQMALQAKLDAPYDLSFADEWQDRASA